MHYDKHIDRDFFEVMNYFCNSTRLDYMILLKKLPLMQMPSQSCLNDLGSIIFAVHLIKLPQQP